MNLILENLDERLITKFLDICTFESRFPLFKSHKFKVLSLEPETKWVFS